MSSDRRPPYHRRQTKPIPRVELAPISRPQIESDPEPETLVPCPCCDGEGMVSAEQYAAWAAQHPELCDDEDDPEPPKAA